MGKKIVISGADFSQNGFRTDNVVQVEMDSNSTNPYKVYFLPTALTSPSPYTDPTMPDDAVEKVFNEDGQILIGDEYASLYFGIISGETGNRKIKELTAAYSRSTISNFNQCCRGITAERVDLGGIHFADGVNASCMFSSSDIKELLMPQMVVGDASYMFYNFNYARKTPSDFSFIKKVTGSMANMFQYLRSTQAVFNGIDVSAVTNFNDCFRYCELDDIDLSEWKPTAGVNFGDTFNACLARTIRLDNWNISIAGWASSGMFANTNNLIRVFVTNCTTTVKNNLIGILNASNAGGSSNWVESTEGGKAVLVPGA